MRPRVHKGGKPGQETFYLNVPREIVTSLGIKPDDEFELKVETREGELTLCYRRVKKMSEGGHSYAQNQQNQGSNAYIPLFKP